MEPTKSRQVVVMTGATSGFGVHALKRIAAHPGTRVIVGARGSGRIVPRGVDVLPLDLASLNSVRHFADSVKQQLGAARIDVLVLNAGMRTPNTGKRSADGFELAFAVNHLAHYLLAKLLLPYMADRGRIVITTSDTHDPAITGFAPTALDPEALAHPTASGFGEGMKAYAASKLCNLMTAESLARSDAVISRGIWVVAFNPGLTGGSAGRDNPLALRILMRVLMHTVFRVVALFRPQFRMNSPELSGAALADVALGAIKPPAGHIYVSLVRGKPAFPEPSELARSHEAQDLLWNSSAAMVSGR